MTQLADILEQVERGAVGQVHIRQHDEGTQVIVDQELARFGQTLCVNHAPAATAKVSRSSAN